MSQFFDEVKAENISIIFSEPMKNHTTFRIGGNARYFCDVKSEEEIRTLLRLADKYNIKAYVIGNGSNMLLPDGDIDCLFIHIGEMMSKIELFDKNTIKCQAGALLVKVCNFALENSLSGMEEVYGIPGSVGGCLYMNAGAYGGEMKDFTVKAEYLDRRGNTGICDASEMALSYRHSVFEENGNIITAVYIRLNKGERDEIKSRMNDFMSRRKDKQPLEFPSAGSVFKRPAGYFAGALIEECGLKGKSIGGAQVSMKHAGFIINTGSATAENVISLIRFCQDTVKKEKGVELESEIRLFGQETV